MKASTDDFSWQPVASIEPDGMEECVCISVDHPSGLYITSGGIITHNTTVETPPLGMVRSAPLQEEGIRAIDTILQDHDATLSPDHTRRTHDSGGDPRGRAQSALAFIRGNAGAGGHDTGSERGEQTGARPVEYFQRAAELLKEWAAQNGVLYTSLPWDPEGAEDRGQFEHHVFDANPRWVKIPKGIQGRMGMSYVVPSDEVAHGWETDYGSADEYLQRLLNSNETLSDDFVLHGVLDRGAGVATVIVSQPDYHGTAVPETEIEDELGEAGYVRLDPHGSNYFNPDTNTLILDAHDANVLRLNNGKLMPFDVAVLHPQGVVREALHEQVLQPSLGMARRAPNGDSSLLKGQGPEIGSLRAMQDQVVPGLDKDKLHLHPNQIKFATENSGEFSPENPSSLGMAKGMASVSDELARIDFEGDARRGIIHEAEGQKTVGDRAKGAAAIVKAHGVKGVPTALHAVAGQPGKPTAGFRQSAGEIFRAVFAGRFDKLEAARRGLGDLVKGNDIALHYSEAALNDYMERITRNVRASFGDPTYWHNRSNRARLQKFTDTLLPVAARLNVTGVNKAGDGWEFTDFNMRVGTIRRVDMERLGAQPGEQIPWKGPSKLDEMLTIGPKVPDSEEHVLYRPMPAAVQEAVYADFTGQFPEGKIVLDQWLDPALKDDVSTGPGGVVVPEFNRHALLKSFNEWSPEMRTLFGNEPLPSVSGVEGYTPDVAAQKTLVSAITSATSNGTNSLLNTFSSSARKFKAGHLRESGNVKNLFDGFTARAMEAQREKVRMKTRHDLIAAAAVDEDKVPPEDKRAGLYLPLDTTFEKLYEAHVISRRLDRTKYPALTNAMNPDQRKELVALFGDLYKFYGDRKFIHRDVHRQLLIGAAMTHTENSLIKALQWLLGRFNRNKLVDLGTYTKNYTSNEILKAVELMNHVNFAIVNGLAAPLSAGARRDLALETRIVAELFKGFFADRRALDLWRVNTEAGGLQSYLTTGEGQGIGKIRRFVPQEIFDEGNNLQYMDDPNNMTPWENLKNLDVGAAFLKAIRYGKIDTHPKMSQTYRILRAHAGIEADEKRVPAKDREKWMEDWMRQQARENSPVFMKAFKSSMERFMDYGNVPTWIDPTDTVFPAEGYDRAKQIEKLMKQLVFPFIRWNYNMARQTYRESFGALVAGARAAGDRDGSALRREIGRLMTTAALTGLGAFLVGGGGDDDDEQSLGTNTDAEGNPLPQQLRTNNRINWSAVLRRLTWHGKEGRAWTVKGADASEQDLWYRYRNDPWLPQALILGLLARGRGGDAYKAAGDFGTDMFLSFGAMGSLPFFREQKLFNQYGGHQTEAFAQTGLLTDVLTSPLIPTRLVQHIARVVDPITRQTEPRGSLRTGEPTNGWEDYTPGALEALKMRVPGLSKDLPAAGKLLTGEVGMFEADAWLKNKNASLAHGYQKGVMTKEQYDKTDLMNRQNALHAELKKGKITQAQYEKALAAAKLVKPTQAKYEAAAAKAHKTALTLDDLRAGQAEAQGMARDIAAGKLGPEAQRNLYEGYGVAPGNVDLSRTTGVPMIPNLRTLQELGVGAESARTHTETDRTGRPVTKVSAPDADTVQVTNPFYEVVKAVAGLNVQPLPTGAVKGAVEKRAFVKTPWKPKKPLAMEDWTRK